MPTFIKRTRVNVPAAELFQWHARPGAFERLTPPWSPIQVIERQGGIENGSRVVMRVPVGPTHVRWVAEHRDYIAGEQFRDVQIEGPFARWEHTHRCEADGPTAAYLEDRVDYDLPFGALGALFGGGTTRSMLERTFAYRHRITADDLAAHAAHLGGPLHVLVSGSTGLVGSVLVPFLTTGGHRVTRLRRSPARAGEDAVQWDPVAGQFDRAALAGIDAVVHLAGENIAAGRWSAETKARIRESRSRGTRLLAETLATIEAPPRVLVSASAIGFYGDRGAEVMREESESGAGFLAEVCREWEAATAPAEGRGIRVVHLRIGVVLTAAGGALAKLLPPFRFGAGGRVGSGTQYMSWIGVDDLVSAILHALRVESVRGALNATAPQPVTNAEFTATLGRVLHRPTIVPLPAAAARAVLGEMADEMLLASTRVEPAGLLDSGYRFRLPDLESALRHTLGR